MAQIQHNHYIFNISTFEISRNSIIGSIKNNTPVSVLNKFVLLLPRSEVRLVKSLGHVSGISQ